jgi:hypothetical protein
MYDRQHDSIGSLGARFRCCTAGQRNHGRALIGGVTSVNEGCQLINGRVLPRIGTRSNGVRERLLVSRLRPCGHVISSKLLYGCLLLHIIETQQPAFECCEQVIGALLPRRTLSELTLRARGRKEGEMPESGPLEFQPIPRLRPPAANPTGAAPSSTVATATRATSTSLPVSTPATAKNPAPAADRPKWSLTWPLPLPAM